MQEVDEASPGSRNSHDEGLFSEDEAVCAKAVARLKCALIGSDRRKRDVIERGVLPRLLALVSDGGKSHALRTNAVYVLGSIAKGHQMHMRALVEADLGPLLLNSEFGGQK